MVALTRTALGGGARRGQNRVGAAPRLQGPSADPFPTARESSPLASPTPPQSLALTADPTPTWSVALALTSLQQQIGIIPHISGIGPAALRVREALAAQREDSAPFPEAAEGAGAPRKGWRG